MHTLHEYHCDLPVVRQLIDLVRETLAATPPAEALTTLQPSFVAVLADPTWLPERYRQPESAVRDVPASAAPGCSTGRRRATSRSRCWCCPPGRRC